MDPNTLIDQLVNRSEFSENITHTRELLDDLQDGFANKYVLYFGDDYNDFGYRVLIQQRGYAGAVLPMIGTNDPVVLQWEGDDDFYEPIKGSRCNINLMVTDAVGYDDFYAEPEQSYKVLLQWFGYDAPPPANGPQTWNTFWTGYLVADTFQEMFGTKPYPISLTAIDGLGTLDAYVVDPIIYSPQFGSENSYPLQIKIIADILRNLDLKLDILATHEWLVYQRQQFTANTAAFDCFLFQGKQLSTKDILSAILKSTNSRIFQSDNKWCIIPNSCYEAKGFSNSISSYTNFLGYQPPDILALKTQYLQTNGSEVVEFERFDQFGAYLNQTSKDAHVAMPSDVQAINNNMLVEYLPAYKEVGINYNVESFNRRKYQINPNQFFNYHDVGYNISEGFIGRYEYTLEDSPYSFRALQNTTNEAFYIPLMSTQMVQTSENIFFNRRSQFEVNIQYLYDTEYQGAISVDWTYKFRYAIKIQYGTTTQYYDAENESWSGLGAYINEPTSEVNQWRQWINTSVDFMLPSGPLYNETITIEVIVYRPYLHTQAFYNALYVGEVSMQVKDNANLTKHNYKSVQANNSKVLNLDRQSVEHITGFTNFGAASVENGMVAQRPRDNYATWVPTNRAQVINKEIMNDFRSSLSRYEGTIKNNHYKPLSMLNRVWINFGTSVFQLPDSCYIDSMAVNLKRNEYKVNMHLPNIDTDQVSTESNQFGK